jgi:hypothetical protein
VSWGDERKDMSRIEFEWKEWSHTTDNLLPAIERYVEERLEKHRLNYHGPGTSADTPDDGVYVKPGDVVIDTDTAKAEFIIARAPHSDRYIYADVCVSKNHIGRNVCVAIHRLTTPDGQKVLGVRE